MLVGPKAKSNLTAEGFGNSLKNVRPKLPLSNRINRNPNDQWVTRGRLDANDISLEVYGNGQDNSSTDAKDIGAAGSLNGSGLFHLSPYFVAERAFQIHARNMPEPDFAGSLRRVPMQPRTARRNEEACLFP